MLTIRNLSVAVGQHKVVDNVSLSVNAGQMVGLVGESGCGKSVTALSVLGLLPHGIMSVPNGQIHFQGTDLLRLSDRSMRAIRGNTIGMIFQEPATALNPVFTIGDQVVEALLLHERIARRARNRQGRVMAMELLERVGLGSVEKLIHRYPHELSGGQRQRVMIAMAMACNPKVLIADEPTTALDVTVQAQILELLQRLCQQQDMAVLLITHDLAVVQHHCDHVYVMYCGQVVEQGGSEAVFNHARHRYSQALLSTVPAANKPGSVLPAIAGAVPQPGAYPDACRFAPRCAHTVAQCNAEAPVLSTGDHAVRCWNPVS